MKKIIIATTIVSLLLWGCVTAAPPPKTVESVATESQQVAAQKTVALPTTHQFKRKLAIARFINASNYGRALLSAADYDAFGKQASDMLMSKLVLSKRFLVFERPDLQGIQDEQKIVGDQNLVGVDSLIIGSLTEFGRSVEGKVGFLNSTKVQTAHAKVDIRLVDVSTGLAFFSATGSGEAKMETGEVAGFGSYADYNSTLNDRAISAAVSDVVDKLVSALEQRPWKTDILQIQDGKVYISGGKSQGLKPGDSLQVMKAGEQVKSKQSGFKISLPPAKVATITVESTFGENETSEGAICSLKDGKIDPNASDLYIQEVTP